jgi:hypothetical protein
MDEGCRSFDGAEVNVGRPALCPFVVLLGVFLVFKSGGNIFGRSQAGVVMGDLSFEGIAKDETAQVDELGFSRFWRRGILARSHREEETKDC